VLDVREPDEFAGARKYGEARGGHVPGAVNLPWHGLLAAAPDVPRDRPIVVYCTGGVRSSMAWAALTAHGFVSVTNDDGSWWAWSRAQP
jgi:thiosulfate/3-mercaptopyruvate sulfurtransferase